MKNMGTKVGLISKLKDYEVNSEEMASGHHEIFGAEHHVLELLLLHTQETTDFVASGVRFVQDLEASDVVVELDSVLGDDSNIFTNSGESVDNTWLNPRELLHSCEIKNKYYKNHPIKIYF